MKTRIEIERPYETALRAAGLADFDAMMRVKGGPSTSRHKHRETLPIEIPVDGAVRTFYLKRVFRVPAKHVLGPLLRGRMGKSQPAQEWCMLGELASAGLAAMKRVAFGERRRWGLPTSAFLLVEAVPMAYTLENWLVPGFPKPELVEKRLRDRLVYELGLLVRGLHDEGFDWPDINAKHIYAAPRAGCRTGPRWEFCLIDVERMTRRGHCESVPSQAPHAGRGSPAKALAKLRRSLLPMQFDRWDAWRLLAGVCPPDGRPVERRDAKGPPRREKAEALLPSIVGGSAPRLPDDYEHPRCVTLRRHGKMVADERALPWLKGAGVRCIDDVFAYAAGNPLDKAGLAPYRDRVRMSLTDGRGRHKTFYLKRYRRPPLSAQIRRILECGLRSSSAGREMRAIKTLSLHGIPTLRGVAFGQQFRGLLEARSFGITEGLDGRSLEIVTNEMRCDGSERPSWEHRKETIRQLALIARRLHERRLFHRDFYLCHVFLTHNADGGIVLRVIDLARMVEKRVCSRRWIIKDLAALAYSAPSPAVTRADRLRFLYDYLGHSNGAAGRPGRRPPVPRRDVRRDIGSIEARVRRMARHDAKRARRREREDEA